jgi:23S rRNA (pseudouridine1915-N3)-methyltransferase
MKMRFMSVGKNHESFVKEGIELFTGRLNHYFHAQWEIIPPLKQAGSLSETDMKKKEALSMLERLEPTDYVVLLDERGKTFSSEGLAQIIQQRANESTRQLVFLIGGAYGVDATVKQRANLVWSLSPLVFPHQLVRLILAEQIYRACTILKNEKYHHS